MLAENFLSAAVVSVENKAGRRRSLERRRPAFAPCSAACRFAFGGRERKSNVVGLFFQPDEVGISFVQDKKEDIPHNQTHLRTQG